MSLRNEILLVTNAAQYVASPADSVGTSPAVETSVPGVTLAFPVAVSGDNASGERLGTTWTPTGAVASFNALRVIKDKSGPDYTWDVAFARWDTSSIPDAATITAASIEVYITSKIDGAANYNIVADYYDYGGDPIVAGDLIETASPSIVTAYDLTLAAAGAVNSLQITDFTGISKTGVTGIRFTFSSGTPASINEVYFAAYGHPTAPAPRLNVTYTLPPRRWTPGWPRMARARRTRGRRRSLSPSTAT